MQHRLADQRAAGLDRRLDVGRRHVLAGGVDDQLLLAVDDLAGTRPRRSRRCRRCAASRRSRSPRRSSRAGCGSPIITNSPRTSTSPSSASLISTPGAGRPDGPDLDRAGAVARAGAAGLRHPPQLGQLDPERVEELQHLDRRRRGADVDGHRLVEPEHRAEPGEHTSRRPRRPAPRARAGTGSPRWRSRTRSIEAAIASSTGLRCSSGWAASIVSSPALSFSQIRGTAKNQVGWTCGRYERTSRGFGQQVIVPA